MRIAVGSDHRGYNLKEQLIGLLRSKGHEVTDVGATGSESVDYPDFAALVARKVSAGAVDRGILICGTGIGMAIAANKFPGVRAAPCYDEVTAELSRRHNNLNVLCLSADMLSPRTVERMVEVWIATQFEGGRHERRVEKIHRFETPSQ
ncbi:MAG: ribose 5-phosphate isomerase B [Planctomycetota bacterium]|nr:MAG: ribose 5-phosphate isomerase B [Planctomycetota bacterium]